MINQGIMPAFPEETRRNKKDYWTCTADCLMIYKTDE